MKIANIVTNVVLGAAVVVLFVLHFTGGEKKAGHESTPAGFQGYDSIDIKIAFFNMDSVMAEWDLYFQYQQEIAKKQTDMETEFSGKTETYYQNVQDAQYKIQRGLVTRSEAEQLQQQLADEQQRLMNLQDQYTAQLQEEGMVRNRRMLDMIERYVAELSEANGYSYVYSYTFGGNLIYGAKPFDITAQVVAGLNERYKPGTEVN
jgi:outer membrane protein